MKVLITSGGTREFIDDVRVLTNISTGRLGATLADIFLKSGHEVYYIHAKTAALPTNYTVYDNAHLRPIDSVGDLMTILEDLVPKVDVVIHAMAVSDFTFEKKEDVKLKSNDVDAFIEHLRSRIKINPKVISYIKTWNPKVKLVGFKFEVGLTNEKLIDIAYESLKNNDCDFVVANDKIEMDKRGTHVAYIIDKNKEVTQAVSREHIAYKLLNILK